MFNKPSVFGRNDPVSRRDVPPASRVNAQVAPPLGQSAVTAKSVAEPAASVVSPASTGANAQAAQPLRVVNPPSPAVPAAKEPSVNESMMGASLIVGPDVKLKGAEILDCDTLVVEGRVEATMDSRVIRIAENGSFCGTVSIDIAEIHGAFEGELTARSQLIIHSTGRVNGTIRYGKLVADEGGILCGDVNVISGNEITKVTPVIEPIIAFGGAAAG